MDQSSQIDRASDSESLSVASFVACIAVGAWVSLAISCWAYSAWTPNTKLSPSGLTTIAIASAIAMSWVRFYPADLQRHATWLQLRTPIALAAAINWLGFILIRCPEALAALPSLLVIGFAEAGVWIINRRTSNACPTNHTETTAVPGERPAEPPRREQQNIVDQRPFSADQLESLLADELSSLDETESAKEELGELLTRTLRVGTDEQGSQYIAGELFVKFNDDERVTHAIVGFQPAFSLPPNVEVESENADIAVEIQNCTPVGMRLQLKLDRSSTSPASTIVAFYAAAAVESAAQPCSTPLP